MTENWKTGAGEAGGHQEVVAHDMAHQANDWRCYQVQKLGLERLDGELEKAHVAWVKAFQDWEGDKLWVWTAKRELEDLEKMLLSEMDETEVQAAFAGVRSSQTERDARRQAMMEQDPRYQSKARELQDAETSARKSETRYTVAEEERKHLRVSIGWRQTLVDFWRTVSRVPIVYAPDEDGVIPEPIQSTGSIHDVPQAYTEEATMRWLVSMGPESARYGPAGQLSLQVLPAGVNPNDGRVVAMLGDIRSHFRQEHTL